MASNRPLLVDFVPSTVTIPDFAQAMLAFFGSEMDAESFWSAQESYFPDVGALQIFYVYMMYTFANYQNLQDMLINMSVYSVAEAQAPDMPEAYNLFFQIFTLMSRGQLFINKINYYGQDEDDVLRMPDFYANNVAMTTIVSPDLGALDERYILSPTDDAPTMVQYVAAQTPV